MPWINQEKCIGCGVCVNSCPVDAISIKDGKAIIDQNRCTFCGNCFSACPHEVIRPNSENPALRGGRHGRSGMGRGGS